MRLSAPLPLAVALATVPMAAGAQELPVPPIVRAGFEALTQNGVDRAVDVWFAGSSLEGDQSARNTITRQFHTLPDWLGRPVGYEVVRHFTVGQHLSRTYAVLLFEGGPMYFALEYYRAPQGWILQHLDFNTTAEKIFPAALLEP